MKKRFDYPKSYFTGKDTFFYRLGYKNTIKKFSYFRKTVNEIERFIKNKKAKILDVGCATADILNMFNGNFVKYGIDISDYAIKQGKKDFPEINLKIGDIEKKLPFKSNFFDAIIMMDILEHIEKQEFLLNNAKDMLKKDGLIFITTPNNNIFRKLFYKYVDKKEHHIKLLNIKQLKELVLKSGFKIVDCWTYPTARIPDIKFKSNFGTELFLVASK